MKLTEQWVSIGRAAKTVSGVQSYFPLLDFNSKHIFENLDFNCFVSIMMPIHFEEVWQMMGAWRQSRIHPRVKQMSKMLWNRMWASIYYAIKANLTVINLLHSPAFCSVVRIISHHCTNRGGCFVSNALEMTNISCRPATNFLVCFIHWRIFHQLASFVFSVNDFYFCSQLS